MHHLSSIFLTLLFFLTEGNFVVAKNQVSSASLGDLCGLAVNSSSSRTPGGYDVSYDYDALNRLTMVYRGQEGSDPTSTQLAAYNYDANGNLNGTGYANGVQHAYTYNSLNRLTNLNVARSVGVSPTSLQGYAYQLNKNGHRTQITELSGRTITNTYDKLHRLTREAITLQSGRDILSQPSPTAGTLSYIYDPVGNRTSRTTTGPVATIIPNQTQSFTVNDRLTTDTYDANGNTTESRSVGVSPTSSSDIYSFDNRLIRRITPDGKTIDLTYNPDGHRLTKFITQNALTQRLVHYLTDANNPTGYAQVIEETHPLEAAGSKLKKVNLYGHDLISSLITDHSALITKPIFYNYDGLGSVRSISNATGDLQETYDYDAYGTLIGLNKRNPTTGVLESSLLTDHSALLTQSEFLYTGEQWDADLGMYFLRARYLNTNTGRFHSQDTYEGRNGEPLTLHKYLYANGNPASFTDPSGRFSLSEMSVVQGGLIALSNLNFKYTSAVGAALFNSLTQARLIALGGPLVYELDQLSRTLLPVSSDASGRIVSLRNKIQDAISAPKVFFNVYFPAFLASLPGKYGVGASIALSAYRLMKLGAFFENIVAQAAQGASFNNGIAHFNASATVHPWSSGLSAFGAFGMGGTGATPALDVLYLNLGVQSVIGGDLQGGAFWMSEFSRSTSRYHLEVKGDFGASGNNLSFGGNFKYNQ